MWRRPGGAWAGIGPEGAENGMRIRYRKTEKRRRRSCGENLYTFFNEKVKVYFPREKTGKPWKR